MKIHIRTVGGVPMKILVSAFEPFGGDTLNPAQEVLHSLQSAYEDFTIVKLLLPTEFHASLESMKSAINMHKPDKILAIGQAGGRSGITIERIGINIDDATIEDNAGYAPIDQAIHPLGPAAYFSTLPIKSMVQGLQNAGIQARISNTAGTYVCNHILYGTLDFLHETQQEVQAGFVHIPYLPEQIEHSSHLPTMPLEEMLRSIEICLAIIAQTDEDIALPMGETH